MTTEPTLTQVFGANASQTSTDLVIKKSDLATVGLTASANNTAESMMVALLLLAALYLNTSNQDSTNTDIQLTIVDSDFPQIVTRNSTKYRQITYNVNLQTVDTGFTVDPDNY
ncbi:MULTISPECIES: hypothetical protein [unclassified Nostoc]|uniref:hypothetical protein n=1 Tax=unclassified Nostoc TaxID=2593658 RepID=UPI002AD54BC5|nr:hypothetical protein [Nostoc sp. DedQUE03]MDZ7974031.1 hypothetical protein [Nostoc sp. DedQUE03]MDZ8048532.1 hypothetical protein [Nostoc sp. DedQUE02]